MADNYSFNDYRFVLLIVFLGFIHIYSIYQIANIFDEDDVKPKHRPGWKQQVLPERYQYNSPYPAQIITITEPPFLATERPNIGSVHDSTTPETILEDTTQQLPTIEPTEAAYCGPEQKFVNATEKMMQYLQIAFFTLPVILGFPMFVYFIVVGP